MSRICGIVHPGDASTRHELLRGMLDNVRVPAHRRERVLNGARAAFGWTGVETPNAAERGGVLAVVDGMVVNREELGAKGNDAALVIDLYARHGFTAALERLNGDFAIALFDVPRGVLWLGRDRFGVRPLYWTRSAGLFAFASRPGALAHLPGVPTDVNWTYAALFAASHYRTFDNDPSASPYAAVHQLPPACALRAQAGGERECRWWTLPDAPEFTHSEQTLAQRYRDLFLDAVRLRVREAQSPAFTLSGGMDSSSVLAAAVHGDGRQRHAFSAVYADPTFDESADIAPLASALASRWHRVPVDAPDVFALVREMIAAGDEPVATATWLSHWLLCREVSRHGFRSLFGGLGGDELNAGEYEYFIYHFADLRAAGRRMDMAREIAGWVRHHDHPVYRKGSAIADEAMERLTDPARPGLCRPDRARMERYARALAPGFFDLAAFEPVMDHPLPTCLGNRTWQDMTRETLPCCLRAGDRNCAAMGLVNVHPFLDHRLVEFMFRVPGDLKIRDGVTKVLLREAMRTILPEPTRTRVTKTGWNAPAHVWFAGRDGEKLMDMVRGRAFRERGIYNPAEVERIVQEHRAIVASGAPGENHMMFLWQVLNLETWLDSLGSSVLPQGSAAFGTQGETNA
ncbi:asparagine synthase (glutamine-hydrolysing) [Desulfobaculum xiamenense]|uniref:asparagine synthase (glutamine-hydrolyzing) n=1 Tax=Desulfobaculum xiamenense TaxID=995050 RepID=A0A846QJ42_9BACT|nr:asparagine synthase-related protein [Desulfobaculum xiamenense]NJB67077.1 asparagine synthase (glutamine-hydrolysing) [Desulfobaculum xiamenense]